jgi:hypothetical protein
MSNAGDFDCHVDVAVGCRAHRPMKHILGFTRSQWMPSSGKCSYRIAAAASVVNDFSRKHKH